MKPGDTLSVRVPLQAPDTGDVHVAATTFTIPSDMRPATGSSRSAPRDRTTGTGNLSLEETMAKLTSQPSYMDLQLEVRMRGAHRLIQIIPQDRPLTNYDEVDLNLRPAVTAGISSLRERASAPAASPRSRWWSRPG